MKESLLSELKNLIEVQKYKFPFAYPVSGVVPFADQATLTIDIAADAAFLCEKITMSVIGPCDSLGLRIPGQGAGNQITSYPMAGTNPVNTDIQYADHGLSFQITDAGSNRQFTSGNVAVELMGTPGYREQFYVALPFRYLARERAQLRFDFVNRDRIPTGSGAVPVAPDTTFYHYVAISLIGFKYYVPSGERLEW